MMTTSLLAAGRSPLPRSSPLKERPHHEDNCSLLACCQVPEAPASSFRVTRLTGYGECAWDRTCARAPEGDAYTGIRSSIGDWKSWERALGHDQVRHRSMGPDPQTLSDLVRGGSAAGCDWCDRLVAPRAVMVRQSHKAST